MAFSAATAVYGKRYPSMFWGIIIEVFKNVAFTDFFFLNFEYKVSTWIKDETRP